MATANSAPSPADDLDVGTSDADLKAFMNERPGTDLLAFQLKVSNALAAVHRRIARLEQQLNTLSK